MKGGPRKFTGWPEASGATPTTLRSVHPLSEFPTGTQRHSNGAPLPLAEIRKEAMAVWRSPPRIQLSEFIENNVYLPSRLSSVPRTN